MANSLNDYLLNAYKPGAGQPPPPLSFGPQGGYPGGTVPPGSGLDAPRLPISAPAIPGYDPIGRVFAGMVGAQPAPPLSGGPPQQFPPGLPGYTYPAGQSPVPLPLPRPPHNVPAGMPMPPTSPRIAAARANAAASPGYYGPGLLNPPMTQTSQNITSGRPPKQPWEFDPYESEWVDPKSSDRNRSYLMHR